MPNYENMQIEAAEKTGTRKRRVHMCQFCHKDQSNLKLHLKRKHLNEPEVQTMVKESANNFKSRKPMRNLLRVGDHMYNTNTLLNKGKGIDIMYSLSLF